MGELRNASKNVSNITILGLKEDCTQTNCLDNIIIVYCTSITGINHLDVSNFTVN